MKYIAPIIIVICLATQPNAQESDSPLQQLHDSARAAYQDGRWVESAQLYTQAAALPEAGEAGGILYNAACSWSLAGNADSAFAYMARSIQAGYDNLDWLKQDSDFDYLRQNHPERYSTFVDNAPGIIQQVIVDKTPIAILSWNVYNGATDLSRYKWDDYDNASFDTLRTTYKLAEIAGDSPSEFERMKRVLDWVSTRWEHVGDNECPNANALTLLRRAETGDRFRCVEYAILLANCYTALGYPARVVGLGMYPVAFGYGRGHVVAEVWSNEFQKWIVCDGQTNAWWTARGNDTPLSADECRRLLTSGQDSLLVMNGQNPEWDYTQLARFWAKYCYHINANFQQIYFRDNPPPSRAFEYLAGGVEPELYFQGFARNLNYTTDHDLFYPQLNQTSAALSHAANPADSLTVSLDHTMPFFERFEARIDDGAWTPVPARFSWHVHPGQNTLEVRAVSQARINGAISRVQVFSNLGMSEDKP